MTSIFSNIRESCKYVAEKARWVTVDYDRILQYPEQLLIGERPSFNHTEEHHLLHKGEDTLRFFVILDSINFGSGYFPFLDKDTGVSGYFTIAKRLKEYCEEMGVPDARFLASVGKETCSKIFTQEITSVHMDELMSLFALALSDLGSWAEECYDGDLLGFLRTAKSADEAVNLLVQMRGFHDVDEYFGTKVFFLKRAQILLQDIKLAEPEHSLIQFGDIDDLTVFADNILPYVFHSDGLITYDPWLEARIANEELIGSGSLEEVEIRACSVYAAEQVAQIIRDEVREISVRELDFLLWNRGQKLKKFSLKKRHRTRCMYY